jgi:hypothetical protein
MEKVFLLFENKNTGNNCTIFMNILSFLFLNPQNIMFSSNRFCNPIPKKRNKYYSIINDHSLTQVADGKKERKKQRKKERKKERKRERKTEIKKHERKKERKMLMSNYNPSPMFGAKK